MSNEQYYIQVKIQTARGEMVVWIPEQLARVGATLVTNDRPWENWEVREVYKTNRIPHSYLLKYERDYKHQRDASDI